MFSSLASNNTFWSSFVAIHLLISELLSLCICFPLSLSSSDGRSGIMEVLQQKKAEFLVALSTSVSIGNKGGSPMEDI